jgi:integrase
MLRLIRKHVAACAETSERKWKCRARDGRSKVACPFYIIGRDPRNPAGPRIKRHTGTCSEQIARARLVEFENEIFNPRPKEAPNVTIEDAVQFFLKTKLKRSRERQVRLRQQLSEMAAYLTAKFGRRFVTDVKKTDLEDFTLSWHGAYNTLVTRRDTLKSFWKYCFDSDFIPKNITATLPVIEDSRQAKVQRVPTLTPDEIRQIIDAARGCGSVFEHAGAHVARQVLAFTLVERYTGMALVDVTKLRLDDIRGNEIFINRRKTGEPVYTAVPRFVIDTLNSFPPDGPEHFFWSGEGLLKTRRKLWGERLQKLYAFAGVRVRDVVKKRRSGGKLKSEPEVVRVSSVTPHFWRHTFVRDHYLRGTSVEDIADLIGDDAATVRRHYSSFDRFRQRQLLNRQEAFWQADPVAQEIMSGAAKSVPIQ